jgi:glucosamine-6-phosphate deaminase
VKIVVLAGPAEVAEQAAQLIQQVIQQRPAAVLGLSTGSSPIAVYQSLAARCRAGTISFAGARGFLLDEYLGLPATHPQRYRNVIARDFESLVDFAPDAVAGPDAFTADHDVAGAEYERQIQAAGGIDLQLLGIGANGHLAFNEPGSPLDSRTRRVALAQQTRSDNARFFPDIDQVPTEAITQGLGTIQQARQLLLLATGAGKAGAVATMVHGNVSADCPASILQLHPQATALLDQAAASKLDR